MKQSRAGENTPQQPWEALTVSHQEVGGACMSQGSEGKCFLAERGLEFDLEDCSGVCKKRGGMGRGKGKL